MFLLIWLSGFLWSILMDWLTVLESRYSFLQPGPTSPHSQMGLQTFRSGHIFGTWFLFKWFFYRGYYTHTLRDSIFPVFMTFHQLNPLGRCVFVCLSVCLSDVPFSYNFFCMVGLVQSVPRPWTGAISISISSRALKTRMWSGVQSWSWSWSPVEP